MIRNSLRNTLVVWGAVLAFPSINLGATSPDTICDPGAPKHCVTPLAEGDIAPYGGQLLTPQKAIAIWRAAKKCQTELDMALEEAAEIQKLRQLSWKTKIQLSEKHWQLQLDLVKRELDLALKAKEIPFWKRPWFIAAGTVLATTGIFYVSTQTIKIIGR